MGFKLQHFKIWCFWHQRVYYEVRTLNSFTRYKHDLRRKFHVDWVMKLIFSHLFYSVEIERNETWISMLSHQDVTFSLNFSYPCRCLRNISIETYTFLEATLKASDVQQINNLALCCLFNSIDYWKYPYGSVNVSQTKPADFRQVFFTS